MNLEKRLLHRIFGVRCGSEMVEGDRFHLPAVLAVDLFKDQRISSRAGRSHPAIVVRLGDVFSGHVVVDRREAGLKRRFLHRSGWIDVGMAETLESHVIPSGSEGPGRAEAGPPSTWGSSLTLGMTFTVHQSTSANPHAAV